MGQKVNPHGLRVGVIKGWDTQWYADKKEFSAYLKEDNTIRTFLKKKYYQAAVSRILIERAAGKIVVTVPIRTRSSSRKALRRSSKSVCRSAAR